jgi:hypothetical protein
MIFTSLGSILGADHTEISQAAATQEDDTYAWLERKVVCLG